MDTFWFEANKRRRRGGRWFRVAALSFVILLVTAASGTAFAAYRSERGRSHLILPGIVIQGVAVGGMTRAQALDAVSAVIEHALSRQITLEAGGRTWTASARSLGLQADVSPAVDAALAYSQRRSIVSRLLGRWRGQSYPLVVGVAFSVNDILSTRLMDEVERSVARAPRDAQLALRGTGLVRVKARSGAALDTADSERRLHTELLAGATRPDGDAAATLRFRVRTIPPKVGERSLGRTIGVNLSENRLTLYQGVHVLRTFPVATAKPGFRTPPGDWTILDKKMYPTWYNPAPNTWGANEPLVVPPGPGNPMGTRAFYLNAPGLTRIHGTNEPSSIGHYASHGCIRLSIPDVEELYDLVPVGTHVLIYGAPPWGIPTTFGVSGV
jgi:L,D-transpeptidase catalytic domain/Putative peptidoglycan binding domain